MDNKAKYKRILLKLSGEVLEGKKGSGIDFDVLEGYCREIAELKKSGIQIAIVIGGGNFWRFRDFSDSRIERVHSDYMGMVATMMNAIAIQDMFRSMKVKARALSTIPFEKVIETYVREKAIKNMEDGEIIICAGGTGSPFFTTDSAAALKALELDCDVLLKGTKVDYIYDKDPVKHKDAKSYSHITYARVLEDKLGVMDLSAVSLCMDSHMEVIVFNQTKKGNLAKVVKGENVGTIIS